MSNMCPTTCIMIVHLLKIKISTIINEQLQMHGSRATRLQLTRKMLPEPQSKTKNKDDDNNNKVITNKQTKLLI